MPLTLIEMSEYQAQMSKFLILYLGSQRTISQIPTKLRTL